MLPGFTILISWCTVANEAQLQLFDHQRGLTLQYIIQNLSHNSSFLKYWNYKFLELTANSWSISCGRPFSTVKSWSTFCGLPFSDDLTGAASTSNNCWLNSTAITNRKKRNWEKFSIFQFLLAIEILDEWMLLE